MNDMLAGIVFIASCELVFLPDYPSGIEMGICQGMKLILLASAFWKFIIQLYLSQLVSDAYDSFTYCIDGFICQIGNKGGHEYEMYELWR